MENERQPNSKVTITKAVFDGLEFIRQSGVTNMLNKSTVLELAREWEFHDTADWIENADTRTYAQLIFHGPEVVTDSDMTHQMAGAWESNTSPGFLDGEVDRLLPDQNENPEPERQEEVHDSEDLSKVEGIDEKAKRASEAIDQIRRDAGQLISELSILSLSAMTDSLALEQRGSGLTHGDRKTIEFERNALLRNLGQVGTSWHQLEEALIEINRGIGSLQYLSNRENS